VTVTVGQLAELVHGQVVGDGDLLISAARPAAEAQAGEITFIEDAKHVHLLQECQASAVVVPSSVAGKGRCLIRVDDPLGAFVTIVRHLHCRPEPAPHGLDKLASVHSTVRIGAEASVFPFAVIGEGSILGERCTVHSGVVIGRYCRVGDDVILYPNAVLYDGSVIGDRTIIHANAVIGADGFGYRLQNGRHVKVPQLGHTEIGADVEVGACSTIDCGTFQATRVGDGTKIDNLVMIAHNCQIGRHNLLISQTGIAGSSTTGDYVVTAGQAGIVDHVRIGDRAVVGAQAGVIRDVAAGECVFGSPARPDRDMKRMIMSLEKLPEFRRDLRKIKQHLGLKDEE
jgi:UDP-3-O-[3-hydroxymyristoyl] glucosamine N-acyltransferase